MSNHDPASTAPKKFDNTSVGNDTSAKAKIDIGDGGSGNPGDHFSDDVNQ